MKQWQNRTLFFVALLSILILSGLATTPAPLSAQDRVGVNIPNVVRFSEFTVDQIDLLTTIPGGTGAAFSSDSQLLLTGENDLLSEGSPSALYITNLTNGYYNRIPHAGDILSLAVMFNNQNQNVVTGSANSGVYMWDTTGAQTNSFFGHPGPVQGVSLSPNARYLASAGGDVRIWDIRDGADNRTYPVKGYAREIAFSPGSRLIAYSVWDRDAGGGVTVWNLDDDVLFASLPHPAEVNDIEYNMSGFDLVTGANDGIARIWNYGSQRLLAELPHGGRVLSVAYNREGTLLATGSSDGTINLWSWNSTTEETHFLRTLSQGSEVTALAISQDNRWLASAGADGLTRIWGVRYVPPIREVLNFVSRDELLRFKYPADWLVRESGSTVLVGNSQEAMDAADRDAAVEGGFAAYIYKRTLDDIYGEDNTVNPSIHPQVIMQDVVNSYKDEDTLEFGIVNRGRINNWRMGRVTFIDRESGLSQNWLIMEIAQETYLLVLTYAPMDEGQLFQSPLLGILDTLDYTYIPPEADEANEGS